MLDYHLGVDIDWQSQLHEENESYRFKICIHMSVRSPRTIADGHCVRRWKMDKSDVKGYCFVSPVVIEPEAN